MLIKYTFTLILMPLEMRYIQKKVSQSKWFIALFLYLCFNPFGSIRLEFGYVVFYMVFSENEEYIRRLRMRVKGNN